MKTEVVTELRENVRPLVEQLIALAAEKSLSRLSVREDGIEITIRRSVAAAAASDIRHGEESLVPEEEQRRLIPVLSTLVGVFKTRAGADKPPASTVGSRVEQGQVLGYIESMRLTYEVHAPSSGRLAEILVEEGLPVEYGQALMVLEATK